MNGYFLYLYFLTGQLTLQPINVDEKHFDAFLKVFKQIGEILDAINKILLI